MNHNSFYGTYISATRAAIHLGILLVHGHPFGECTGASLRKRKIGQNPKNCTLRLFCRNPIDPLARNRVTRKCRVPRSAKHRNRPLFVLLFYCSVAVLGLVFWLPCSFACTGQSSCQSNPHTTWPKKSSRRPSQRSTQRNTDNWNNLHRNYSNAKLI